MGHMEKPTGSFNQSVYDLMMGNSYIAYSDQMLPKNESIASDLSTLKFLEVGVWWCTKTYRTAVDDGKSVTEEVGVRSELVQPSVTVNLHWARDFFGCYVSRTCNKTYGAREAHLRPPPHVNQQDDYRLHVWTALKWSASLGTQNQFQSAFIDRNRGVIASNGGGIAKAYAVSLFGDFYSTALPSQEDQMRNTRALARNSAQTLTNL